MGNLIDLLGKIKRKNTDFSGYATNPAYFDKLGEEGISVHQTPWLPKSVGAITLGNSIFIGPDTGKGGYVGATHPDAYMNMVKEEVPHVGQYREKGFLGFTGKYLWDIFKNKFSRDKLYKDSKSLEGFHSHDLREKERLTNIALNKRT